MLLGVERVGKLVPDLRLQFTEVLVVKFGWSDLPLGLPGTRCQIANRCDDLLDLCVREVDRIDHAIFRNLFRSRLDHHNPVFCTDDHNVELTVTHLGIARIHDHGAVDQANTNCADRSAKRYIGKRQCCRCGIDRRHVRIILGISREHQCDHLRFIFEIFRKERPNGTINLPSRENFALTRTAFALDKSAGNTSTGVCVFAIINGQRKEVLSFARLRSRYGRSEYYVVADSDYSRTGSLFSYTTSFKFESLTACEFNGCVLLHEFLISLGALPTGSLGAMGKRTGAVPSTSKESRRMVWE